MFTEIKEAYGLLKKIFGRYEIQPSVDNEAMCMTGLNEEEDTRLRYLLKKRIGTMTEEELNEARAIHAKNIEAFVKKYG